MEFCLEAYFMNNQSNGRLLCHLEISSASLMLISISPALLTLIFSFQAKQMELYKDIF